MARVKGHPDRMLRKSLALTLATHVSKAHGVGMAHEVTSDLLTTPQVAALLGKSVRTVHRLIADERLTPAQKLPGPNGAYLFDRAAVAALLVAAP